MSVEKLKAGLSPHSSLLTPLSPPKRLLTSDVAECSTLTSFLRSAAPRRGWAVAYPRRTLFVGKPVLLAIVTRISHPSPKRPNEGGVLGLRWKQCAMRARYNVVCFRVPGSCHGRESKRGETIEKTSRRKRKNFLTSDHWIVSICPSPRLTGVLASTRHFKLCRLLWCSGQKAV